MNEILAPAARRLDGPTVALIVALGLLTAVVYAGVGSHEFVEFDDREYVLTNSGHDGRFDFDDLQRAFLKVEVSNWAPVSSLSLSISDALYGPNPGAYAWTNVGLHILSSALLFLALVRLTGRRAASAWVAAVFAIHPLHVESVAWISQRKEVLAGVFWMAAIYAHAGRAIFPVDATRRISAWVWLWSGLAMLSKATAVAIPITLLLLDYWPLGRVVSWAQARRVFIEKIPVIAFAGGVSVATLFAQTKAMGTDLPIQYRIMNAALAYMTYLADSVWPSGLAAFYPYPDVSVLFAWKAYAALIAMIGLTVFCVSLWRRWPLVTMGWLWFVLTLVPMIGVVHVGGQSHADRYMYFPQIGLALIVAFGVDDFIQRRSGDSPISAWLKRGMFVLSLSIVLAFAGVAQRQVGVWQSTVALFGHATRVDPTNYFAQGAVGKAYWIAGDPKAAESHLVEALRLRPDAASARVVLATLYLQTGRTPRAEVELGRALVDGAEPATVWAVRGVIAANRGDERGAAAAYERALSSDPDSRDWEMLNNLAWIRAASPIADLRSADQAVALATRAAALRPEDPFVRGTFAAALASAGRTNEAVAEQLRAIAALRGSMASQHLADFQKRLALYRAGGRPWIAL